MGKLDELRSQGFRITEQRQIVLKAITKRPRSVEEIHKALQKKGALVDLASVYRSVQLFVDNNLVHELDFGDGIKRYEASSEHHHHIICNGCGKVEDILLKTENKFIKEAARNSQFKITNHSLEFFGLCQKCQ